MKVRKILLTFLLTSLLIGTAYAQEMRYGSPGAQISFSGTTATCYVIIPRPSADDIISATIELRCGSEPIKTWNEYSDIGFLEFEDTASVSKGKTYELVVEYTVNGKAQESFSVSGTCK